MVTSWLLMRCLEVGISSVGNMVIGIVADCPRIVGVENGVNRFSFILVVSICCGPVNWGFFVRGVDSSLYLAVLIV